MSNLFDIVIQYFEEDDWNFMEVSDGEVLKMGVSGKNGEYNCFAIVNEERETFRFLSSLPVKVPFDKRLAVAELITRANLGLTIGNFELDFDDGEVRYKTGIDVEGDRLSPALVRNLVNTNVLVMDHYCPAIMKVVYGGSSPLEAIDDIEDN